MLEPAIPCQERAREAKGRGMKGRHRRDRPRDDAEEKPRRLCFHYPGPEDIEATLCSSLSRADKKSEECTGTLAPRLDTGCTMRTADNNSDTCVRGATRCSRWKGGVAPGCVSEARA